MTEAETSPRLIIEPGIGEWRSALIDADGFPASLSFHGDASASPVDALFAARVTRVDSQLDMAFLDIGKGEWGSGLEGMLNLRRAKLLVKGKAGGIAECVTEGQRLMVQVVAEPSAMDAKALAVTPRPKLLGRYVAVEAGGARLNFSKDLSAKRQKALKPLLQTAADSAAIIVRSRAASVAPEIVVAEAEALAGAFNRPSDKPGLVFARSPLNQALAAAPDDTDIWVDGGSAFADAKALAATHWPDLTPRLKTYKGEQSAFEAYGVDEAIEEALAERIELPSGGWISITPTPAMTVVDVNMGGALKGRSAGDAKMIVNLEAAMAVAYHMRFQDIGGLVVVDFIDMASKGAARELMATIERALRDDPVPVQHTGLSHFGLVEFSRKRRGLSLRDRLLVPQAPTQRPEAAAMALLRAAIKTGTQSQPGVLVLETPKPVQAWLEARPAFLQALASKTGRRFEFQHAKTTTAWLKK